VSDHIYKMIDLVGFSNTSIENAAQAAVANAAVTEETVRRFEVKESRGHIESGTIAHWQVRISIGAARES
jgi:dodecin